MKLSFIRHGEGAHTLRPPDSLQLEHPRLTKLGVQQAADLRIVLSEAAPPDVIVSSPTRRTLETASIVSPGDVEHVVTPFIGPRVFPVPSLGRTLPCDRLLPKQHISEDFPQWLLMPETDPLLWRGSLNTMPEPTFYLHCEKLLTWCRSTQAEQVWLFSHDGTIAAYRQYITGERITRNDFLGETGIWTTFI
ncbi:histidine phosphatase family protein [Bacillus daqingensis]|uniref:Histidine phosphatase family protein n=1 Tax=Bacillus daqingensis TaxID=872396 RepID=A0ABV9NVG6_9BACI